jgi:hypothetical protein
LHRRIRPGIHVCGDGPKQQRESGDPGQTDEKALIHHSKRQADNLYYSWLYYSWAEGFWSLANMGRMANKNKFKDLITAPQARDQIVNYCNFRPGDAFYQAVMDVYDGFLDADP